MDAHYTGNKITELRKSKNWTRKDIAEKLHVSVAAVSKWERGLNFPDLSLMEPLSEILEISVSELLGLENESADQVIKDITAISEEEKKDKHQTEDIGKDFVQLQLRQFCLLLQRFSFSCL